MGYQQSLNHEERCGQGEVGGTGNLLTSKAFVETFPGKFTCEENPTFSQSQINIRKLQYDFSANRTIIYERSTIKIRFRYNARPVGVNASASKANGSTNRRRNSVITQLCWRLARIENGAIAYPYILARVPHLDSSKPPCFGLQDVIDRPQLAAALLSATLHKSSATNTFRTRWMFSLFTTLNAH